MDTATRNNWAESALIELERHGATFLFDFATPVGLDQADRAVADRSPRHDWRHADRRLFS